MEPIGLYYLAGVLNSNGISTTIIDFNVNLPTRSEFHDYLKHIKPRIVCVTSYTCNFSIAQKIITEVKTVDPKIVTIMGGIHVSALPDKLFPTISI